MKTSKRTVTPKKVELTKELKVMLLTFLKEGSIDTEKLVNKLDLSIHDPNKIIGMIVK